MKRRFLFPFLLLTAVLSMPLSEAAESRVFEDAPKGFIHVAAERLKVEVHHYLRTGSILRVEQFSEESGGQMAHFIRLIGNETTMVHLEFGTKEASDKALAKILEILSSKE